MSTATLPPPAASEAKTPDLSLILDPVEAAHEAGLVYVTDRKPGIKRERDGDGFRYVSPKGEPVTDAKTLDRIKALGIPPAYVDVWICPRANGHLQATGHDARGRKQYRYHAKWRAARDETKYERMMAFGQALPKIRKRVSHDLTLRGMPREKAIATVVRLLETTLIRVGNDEYARDNRSYGLTTMQNHHVDITGSTLHFHFRGKSGKNHDIDLKDKALAQIVKTFQHLPGQDLFEYVDGDGNSHKINSTDVNAYLHEIAGEEFTAKDFRTWAGTIIAAMALAECEGFDTGVQAKKNIVRAIEDVSKRLGNTPAVCRKCYVHPAILETYLEGGALSALRQRAAQELSENLSALRPEESAVLALLQQRLGCGEQDPPPPPDAGGARV